MARWDDVRSEFQLADYGLVTLHRPSNVDQPEMLVRILSTLDRIGQDLPLLFPVHPRTQQRLANHEAVAAAKEIGYPVVLKIVSPDVLHKTEFGGVRWLSLVIVALVVLWITAARRAGRLHRRNQSGPERRQGSRGGV